MKKVSTDNFDWQAFSTGKIAVQCKTKKLAKNFLQEAEKRGCLWVGADNPTSHINLWDFFKNNTCYRYDPDYYYTAQYTTYVGGITYTNKVYYQVDENIEVVKWSKETKQKQKKKSKQKPKQETEIKPCPFCGQTDVNIKTEIGYWEYDCCGDDEKWTEGRYFHHNCQSINGSIVSGYYNTEEDAINAWNSRAN